MSFLLFAALFAHPSHESFSEVEWNSKTGRLEVALRLDALDEQWLKRQLKNAADNKNWPLEYVQSTYRIAELPKKNESDSTKYRWVGREEEGPHVWWYFEIEPNDHGLPNWVEVRVLFEREKNYVHQFVRLDLKPRYSKLLTHQFPRRPFSPVAKSESPSGKPAGAATTPNP